MMWSENRYVEYSMDILLFLLGINVMHYGQLLLPIMCFLLFVDRKMKFYVRSPKTFILLCLFAISFYAFSYKLGFYCVMGFCLPMAYYIGSNSLNPCEENVKKTIYIIAFGMCCHLILNFYYDYTILGKDLMLRNSHYDFWTRGYVAANTTSVNLIFIISSIYYLLFFERDKRWRIPGIVLFIISLIYDLALGKRMPIFIMVLDLIVCVVYDIVFVQKNKKFILVLLVPALGLVLLLFLYFINFLGLKDVMDNIRLVIKIKAGLFDFDRLKILMESLKYVPVYLWGGQMISSRVGIQMHELWMDIYDYAGLPSYVLMVAYSLIYAFDAYKVIKKDSVDKPFRLLLLSFVFCATCIMFLEPVMTGSSLYLICVIIVGTMASCLI